MSDIYRAAIYKFANNFVPQNYPHKPKSAPLLEASIGYKYFSMFFCASLLRSHSMAELCQHAHDRLTLLCRCFDRLSSITIRQRCDKLLLINFEPQRGMRVVLFRLGCNQLDNGIIIGRNIYCIHFIPRQVLENEL